MRTCRIGRRQIGRRQRVHRNIGANSTPGGQGHVQRQDGTRREWGRDVLMTTTCDIDASEEEDKEEEEEEEKG